MHRLLQTILCFTLRKLGNTYHCLLHLVRTCLLFCTWFDSIIFSLQLENQSYNYACYPYGMIK
jgi:hypothetical protein